MSTRYIWDTYNVETIKQQDSGLTSLRIIETYSSSKYDAVAATGYEYDSALGCINSLGRYIGSIRALLISMHVSIHIWLL